MSFVAYNTFIQSGKCIYFHHIVIHGKYFNKTQKTEKVNNLLFFNPVSLAPQDL